MGGLTNKRREEKARGIERARKRERESVFRA